MLASHLFAERKLYLDPTIGKVTAEFEGEAVGEIGLSERIRSGISSAFQTAVDSSGSWSK